ncbi:unnamed protein product [Dovyalis caffra]|uniref:Uncharacterized protein n=1 Tax=Dovyalis caffra TaxID=77055 RepID=A0AAV1R1N0_9ROSI|nr:unnamed protein product [Dovyalis caffra]
MAGDKRTGKIHAPLITLDTLNKTTRPLSTVSQSRPHVSFPSSRKRDKVSSGQLVIRVQPAVAKRCSPSQPALH